MRSCNRSARFARGLASALVILLGSAAAWANMPLDPVPAWQSTPQSYYATGGGWADIDGDGWLDMVVSNGNDMARQQVVIYRNNGNGTLPLSPSWISTDRDYQGHLDIGDLNGDGLPDVAVAVYLGPGRFGDPGCVKVYLNNGAGGFAGTPGWQSVDRFYCFSLALGDADGDGDLDLACATGDDYYDNPEQLRIYYNNGGVLETTPSWMSDAATYALDVVWSDIEGDGDLDLVFCGTSAPLQVYLNHQTTGGGIDTTPAWVSTDLPQFGNTAAMGDWNNDGFPDLAVADNNQMGGAGHFKVYQNQGGALATTPAWISLDGGYGSHVSWIDLDLDGDSDLAAGQWWGAARIFENTGGSLTTSPVWTSSVTCVIENMFWGDVDNDGLRSDGLLIGSGDGARTCFPLGRVPVRSVDEVRVDDVVMPASGYAVSEANGWVSLGTPPPAGSGNVEIRYTYSTDDDLGITTWDTAIGNYLFLNQTPSPVPDVASGVLALSAAPNPMIEMTAIRYRGASAASARLVIFDAGGRLVRTLHAGPLPGGLVTWQWDRRDAQARRVAAGVYFATMEAAGTSASRRVIVLK
jgi:hypothetical protein